MKIKSAYKYQINELSKPIIIYYTVIIALFILTWILDSIWNTNSMIIGFDAATAIFLFVCGLNAFKQPFHMMMANGISRRTLWISTIAAFCTASAGMALIDNLVGWGMSSILPYNPVFAGQYSVWYGLLEGFSTTPLMAANGFVWSTFCNLSAAMVGLLITTAYYRMNKPLKLIVSIGVPVLLLIVMPIIDSSLFHGVIYSSIFSFFGWVTSLLGKGNPYSIVLSNVFSIMISGALTWLLIRRAIIKT